MGVPYYADLPALQSPRNSMLDFSPIGDALDGLRQAGDKNAMFAHQQQREAVEDKRANASLGIQQQGANRAQQEFDMKKGEMALNHFAGITQHIQSLPPEQQPDAWKAAAPLYQRLRTTIPDFDNDAKAFGINADDPSAVGQFIVARQTGMKDPLETRYKEAQIGELNAKASQTKQGGAPPAGYRWSATVPGTQEAIPGGSASKLPSDTAAKVGMMTTALQNLPRLRDLTLGEADPKTGQRAGTQIGPIGTLFNSGKTGEAHRLGVGAIESVLRAASGAAVPEEEVRRYSDLFLPAYTDKDTTKAQKLDQLDHFISNILDAVQTGRPVNPDAAAMIAQGKQAGQAPPNTDPSQPRQAPDGNYYLPDPNRPGKYLRVDQ